MVIGGDDGTSPNQLRAFTNRDDMDFSSAADLPPVQVCVYTLLSWTTGTLPNIRNRSMQNVSYIHGILGGTGPGTGCYFDYSPLFSTFCSCSPLFSDQNVSSISYSKYFLYSVAYP